MIFLLELNFQNLTDQINTQILLNELIESVGLITYFLFFKIYLSLVFIYSIQNKIFILFFNLLIILFLIYKFEILR